MANLVHMNAIRGEGVGGIIMPMLSEVLFHWRVDIDYQPAVFALSQEPFRVAVQHVVIALVGFAIFGQACGLGLAANGLRIEHRRGEEDQLCSKFYYAVVEKMDAVLEFLEAFLAERVVNPVIHPVTGDDKVSSRSRGRRS